MFLAPNAFRVNSIAFRIGIITLRNSYSTVTLRNKSGPDLHIARLTKVVTVRVHASSLNSHSSYRLNRALSNNYHTVGGSEVSASDVNLSYRCSCCGLNTPGDLELAEFLSQELEYEREFVKTHALPFVDGFNLASAIGPVITLTRQLMNEIVRVKFNVMDSVVEDDNDEMDWNITDDDGNFILECFPPFVVEIEKVGVDSMLTLHCVHQPSCEILPLENNLDQEFGRHSAAFEIQRVSVVKKSGGSQKNVIFLSTTDNLHDHLLVTLSERGINETFYQQLVDLSGVIDHRCYVSFLETLKDFARSQPQARDCV